MHFSLSHSCAESALEFSRGRLLYSRPLRSPPGALSFGAVLFFESVRRARSACGRREVDGPCAVGQRATHSLTHSPGRLHPNSRLCVRPPRAAARNLGQLTRAFASTLFLRRQTEGESPASFLTDVVYHVFSRNMVFERVIALRLVSDS